jgi:hypothetical protein
MNITRTRAAADVKEKILMPRPSWLGSGAVRHSFCPWYRTGEIANPVGFLQLLFEVAPVS